MNLSKSATTSIITRVIAIIIAYTPSCLIFSKSLKYLIVNLVKDRIGAIFQYFPNFISYSLSFLVRAALYSVKYIASIIFILSPSNNIFAFDKNQQQLRQQDIQIKQSIEEERQSIIRQKEAAEINNIAKNKDLQKIINQEDIREINAPCRIIKNFNIIGNREVSLSTLNRKFISPLRNSKLIKLQSLEIDNIAVKQNDNANICFTKSDLLNLHNQIINYYIKSGYIIARIYFDSSNISNQEMKIIIEEGRLNNLEIYDNSKINKWLPFRRVTQKISALPLLKKNSTINIRDLEQGIDQINRLSSQNAKISINPAEIDGYSNIIIDNNIGNQALLSLIVDNSGQKNTGKIKHKISFNYDNFLSFNDNIYLNYAESNAIPLFGSNKEFNNIIGTNDNSNNRFSKAFYSAFSLPFGYWSFGSSYSYSRYIMTTMGTASIIKSSGNSEAKNYYIDRVLLRNKQYQISFKAEIGQNDTDSYIADSYIPVNSRRTTETNFYLNNNFYNSRFKLFLQPKYSRGITAFGALKDKKNLDKSYPRAQFESFGLYAQSNLNFNIPKISIPANYKLTFDSLTSKDSLYGLDQFSLGGKHTIRGFQDNIISGDNGYLFKNDLTIQLSNLLPHDISESEFLNPNRNRYNINSILNKLNFGIFYDYGYVRNHIINSANDKGYMSGAGINLGFAGKFINYDVTYAKGLQSPRYLINIDNIPKEKEVIYFSLTFNYGLL